MDVHEFHVRSSNSLKLFSCSNTVWELCVSSEAVPAGRLEDVGCGSNGSGRSPVETPTCRLCHEQLDSTSALITHLRQHHSRPGSYPSEPTAVAMATDLTAGGQSTVAHVSSLTAPTTSETGRRNQAPGARVLVISGNVSARDGHSRSNGVNVVVGTPQEGTSSCILNQCAEDVGKSESAILRTVSRTVTVIGPRSELHELGNDASRNVQTSTRLQRSEKSRGTPHGRGLQHNVATQSDSSDLVPSPLPAFRLPGESGGGRALAKKHDHVSPPAATSAAALPGAAAAEDRGLPCPERPLPLTQRRRQARAKHGGPPRHVCSACGKRFPTPSKLNVHQLSHQGARPHQCPHCPRRYLSRQKLHVHVRTHSGERPFVCHVCGRTFASAAYLVQHEHTHTGLRRHQCPVCGKMFTQRGTMTKHVRKVHVVVTTTGR